MRRSRRELRGDWVSHRTAPAGRRWLGLLMMAGLWAVAASWAAPARADQGALSSGVEGAVSSNRCEDGDDPDGQSDDPVSEWNLIMADMEPLPAFFMHTRLGALLHVAIHDALNAIPKK